MLDLHTTQLAQFLANEKRSTTDAVKTPSLRRLGLLVDLLSTASTAEHMVLLLILFERVLRASEGLLSKISWQPLLLCCFLLTSKELDDDPVSFRDLRMLAVMHDVRSATGCGHTAAKHGESFSSCYNEDIEDIELALLQLLQWSTFCSATDFQHHRQRVIDNSVEIMAEPDDGSPGSSVLCQADWEYMHERLRACTPPAATEPVLSSSKLECNMLDAVEYFLEDLSADREESVPSLASDEEEAQASIEPGEDFQQLPSWRLPLSNDRPSPRPSRKGDGSMFLGVSAGQESHRWQPEMPKWFVAIGNALKEVLPRDDAEPPGRPRSADRLTCRGGPNGLISPQSRCDRADVRTLSSLYP